MKFVNKSVLTFLLCAAAVPMAAAAGNASYPQRPVRLVVPYAVGGATDVIGRVVARYLADELGQPVVVENRPGAGGSTGSDYASKQPADGYTLVMMVESSHAVNPNVYAKPAYDPLKDFTPITNIANVPGVMVVNGRPSRQISSSRPPGQSIQRRCYCARAMTGIRTGWPTARDWSAATTWSTTTRCWSPSTPCARTTPSSRK